jgi:exosortase/archaeosortase family protein
MNRQNTKWIILFCLLMGAFYWLDQSSWFHQFFLSGLSQLIAHITSWILSFLGLHAEVAGGAVITASGRFEIADSCTGSFVFMMFAAALIPFPIPWKSRLWGIFLGLLTLLFLNLFRTSLIILVASRFPQTLWTFHIIVGQVIVIVGMLAVFLWCTKDNPENRHFSLFKSNRSILRALGLFCIGYLCGYWFYQIFLDSSLGFWVKGLIESHSLWIMSVLNDAISPDKSKTFSFQHVTLVEGCLSSPVVVIFVAAVFAWPAKWWKRILIILSGFVPFFYGYHLLRTILVAFTLSFQPKEVNFVYNFYGQALLIMALFALVAYAFCSKQKTISYGKFLRLFLVSALIGAVVTLGLGWVARHMIIPLVTDRIYGSPLLSYNPDQAISTMVDLQVFIWLTLVGTTPGLSWSRKCLSGFFGIMAASAGFVGVVFLIETFQLAPHKGFLKIAVILLPFVVYYLWRFSPKRRTKRHPKEVGS